MNEVETRICRYFNTSGGCWYGDKCKFLHISDEKPRCKFYISSSGCRFGDNCHFSHERPMENLDNCEPLSGLKEDYKENVNPRGYIGTNNNSMELIHATNTLPSSLESNKLEVSVAAVSAEVSKALANIGDLVPEVNNSTNDTIGVLPSSNTQLAVPSSTTTAGTISPILESDFRCGSCKRPVIAQGNESYYNLLKDHYLECFMGKEGDHVKYVKFKAALDPGQMYWCKTCILVFEKPWSLFQHMGDKATGPRLQRWEKKAHMDWLDTVAGLMAGHDLGLFAPGKLRADLRNLLADRRTAEEEMESAALTAAAAMMQFIEHISNPIIAQKAERYLHMGGVINDRRFGSGGGPGGGNGTGGGIGGFSGFPNFFGQGFSKFAANRFLNNIPHGGGDRPFYGNGGHPGRNSRYPHNNNQQGGIHGPGTGGNYHHNSANNTGSNNTNSIAGSAIGSQAPQQPLLGLNASANGFTANQQRNSAAGVRSAASLGGPTSGKPSILANSGALDLGDSNKPEGGSGDVASTVPNNMANWNCGFTEEEVRELLSHGIQPWDTEAAAALSALRGELDHLLE